MNFGKSLARRLAPALVLGLAACASVAPITAESPADAKQAQVVDRANARGTALVQGDLDAAYEFLSEGSKAVIGKDNFKRRMGIVPFRAYRIEAASCEGATCKVQSKLTYDHRLMKGVTTPVTEVWVIERGNAYFIFPAS